MRDKRYLSTMGCLLSVMLIVCVCFFPFPYQDELLQTMITDGEGLENNFIPFHTIISIFGEAIIYHTYGTLCYQFLRKQRIISTRERKKHYALLWLLCDELEGWKCFVPLYTKITICRTLIQRPTSFNNSFFISYNLSDKSTNTS